MRREKRCLALLLVLILSLQLLPAVFADGGHAPIEQQVAGHAGGVAALDV